MKKAFLFISFLFVTANSFSQVYVQGYTKSNGTYVQGHYRTAPNYTRNDNYSTIGNINPYNGNDGTKPADSYYITPTNYSVPSYSSNSTIYIGSRGGQYYINSNGNKTYINR
jgi:hypothetical protein